MELVLKNWKVNTFTKVSIRTIKNTAKENSNGPTDKYTSVNLKMITFMEQEKRRGVTVQIMKEAM